jgi:hygromycin-B 4-O-kinase
MKRSLSAGEVERHLRGVLPGSDDLTGITLLKGGAWSTAYRFVAGGESLVIRFGSHRDDYERDALAGSWQLDDAPTVPVIAMGDASDGCWSILPWRDGKAFDALSPERFDRAQDSLLCAYDALATGVQMPGGGFGIWTGPGGDAPHPTWAAYLVSVPERDDERLRGWREHLHAHEDAHAAFDAAQRELESIAPDCPNLRSVNHGDPLQGNILVGADDRITALLDWGTSVAGDPLYDLAMLIFCGPWQSGIDAARVRDEAHRRAPDADADLRLHACMLHIGLGAMQYQAFAGLAEDLARTAAWVDEIRAGRPPSGRR